MATGPRHRASRRCAPRSTGPTACAPRPSGSCFIACQSSPVTGRWKPPRPCAPATDWTWPRCAIAGSPRRQVVGTGRARNGRAPALPSAAHLRQDGRERLLATSMGQQIQDAHASHFLAVAERAEGELWGPDAPRWLARRDVKWMTCGPCCAGSSTSATALEHGARPARWPASGTPAISEGRTWLRQAWPCPARSTRSVARRFFSD